MLTGYNGCSSCSILGHWRNQGATHPLLGTSDAGRYAGRLFMACCFLQGFPHVVFNMVFDSYIAILLLRNQAVTESNVLNLPASSETSIDTCRACVAVLTD